MREFFLKLQIFRLFQPYSQGLVGEQEVLQGYGGVGRLFYGWPQYKRDVASPVYLSKILPPWGEVFVGAVRAPPLQ
jgi:hypothetical protein